MKALPGSRAEWRATTFFSVAHTWLLLSLLPPGGMFLTNLLERPGIAAHYLEGAFLALYWQWLLWPAVLSGIVLLVLVCVCFLIDRPRAKVGILYLLVPAIVHLLLLPSYARAREAVDSTRCDSVSIAALGSLAEAVRETPRSGA